VTVSANIVAFCRVWLGPVSLFEALQRQEVRLDGKSGTFGLFPVGLPGARWQTRCVRHSPIVYFVQRSLSQVGQVEPGLSVDRDTSDAPSDRAYASIYVVR
jgi:hypothetical protein